MQTLHKNEATWCRMLGHLRCRIKFSLESIRRAVLWEAFYTYRNSDGNLNVRYLNWNGGQWNWNYNWIENSFNDSGPAAVARNSLHFSPGFAPGEFCFISCPCQPPSILPTSSSFTEREIYFLSP